MIFRLSYIFIILICVQLLLANKAKQIRIDSVVALKAIAAHDTARIRLDIELGQMKEINRISYWDSLYMNASYYGADDLVSDVYFNKSNCYMNTGRFDSSQVYITKLMELSTQLEYDDELGMAYGLQGVQYLMLGNKEAAFTNMLKANDYFKIRKNKEYLIAGKMWLGIVYFYTDQFSSAIDHLFTAIELSKQLKDPMTAAESEMMCSNFIGMIYLKCGNSEKALAYFNRTLILAHKTGGDMIRYAMYNNIGVIHEREKRHKMALKAFLMFEESDEALKNVPGHIANLCNIGLVYLNLEEPEKARDYLFRAKRIQAQVSGLHAGAVSTMLGKYYGTIGEVDSAIYYGEKANTHRGLISSVQAVNFASLSDAYQSKGNWKQAFYYSKRHHNLKDSLQNNEDLMQMMGKELDLVMKQKEEEFARSHRKKNIILLVGGVGAVALFIILGMVYNMLRIKRKSFVIISEQKQKVDEQNGEIMASITYAKKIQNGSVN